MSSDELDRIFKALANEHRLEILEVLREKPLTSSELCKHFEGSLDRSMVTQHTGILERAGLIISQTKGRNQLKYLSPAAFNHVRNYFISLLTEDGSTENGAAENDAPENEEMPEHKPSPAAGGATIL